MYETISCGGVVVYRGKILLLYKNQNGKYMGWVLPKGALEAGETFKQAALREVKEEAGVSARVSQYLGRTQYNFRGGDDIISKTVHWYLMTTDSFHCSPQAEEFFADVGFYKPHEAYHLLKYNDEKQIMRRAYTCYNDTGRDREHDANINANIKRFIKNR